MNGALCPTKLLVAELVGRHDRRPFPHRSLRQLQELGPRALQMAIEQSWRPIEKREAE